MQLGDTIRRAASGDRGAQDEIIDACYSKVRSMVHKRLEFDFRKRHRWMLAAFSTGDIVQDVFVDVVRHIDSTDIEDEDSLVRYLATLVRHRIMDTVRHHEAGRRDSRRNNEPDAERGIPEAGHDATPSLAAGLLERIQIVQDAFASFDTRDEALLQMRLVKESPFPEIAEELGFVNAKAARTAFVRAHARLLVQLRAKGLRAQD